MKALRQRRPRYSARSYLPNQPVKKQERQRLFYPARQLLVGLLLVTLVFFGSVYLVYAAPPRQSPEEGQQIFQQQCAACHTIGQGDTVGPDLENVTQRRDIDWVKNFIAHPGQVIQSGDPIATQLLKQYGVPMPDLGLTDVQVEALVAYLQAQASPEAPTEAEPQAPTEATPQAQVEAQPPAEAAPAAPAVGGDPAQGEMLFTGQVGLANGGTHCIACHNVETITPGIPLNGGSLGPDLTHVYQRLGANGLTSTLGALPSFPTMQGVYRNAPLTPAEQNNLLAFLAQADSQAPATLSIGSMWYWGAGTAGMLLLFGGMIVFWPRQRISLAERIRRGGNPYEMD